MLNNVLWGAAPPLSPLPVSGGDPGWAPSVYGDPSGLGALLFGSGIPEPSGMLEPALPSSPGVPTGGGSSPSAGSGFPFGMLGGASRLGGMLASAFGDPTLAGSLGGASNLFGLAGGIANGNPLQAGKAALGTYNSLSSLFPDTVPSFSNLLGFSSAAPGAGLASAEAGIGLGAGEAFAEGAGGMGLGAIAGTAAPLIMGAIEWQGMDEARKARESGWANNPIAGQLYSNATAGIGSTLDLFDQIAPGGDLSQVSTPDLARALTYGTNHLLPYFQTAQGPAGALRASSAVTGLFGRPGLGGTDVYTARAEHVKSLLGTVAQELLNRGVSYEQLGQLPVTDDWTRQTVDTWDPTASFMQSLSPALTAQGQELARQAGQAMDASGQSHPNFTLQDMLTAALGASGFGPGAGSLATSMYGGPLWYALAKSSAGAPMLGTLQEHFNPWATLGQMSPDELVTALTPYVLQPWLMEEQARASQSAP